MPFFKKPYTEQELIKGCAENDRRCQEELYKRFFPDMMAFCMQQVRKEDLAMEILNAGFLRVFQKIQLYSSDKGALGAWIRTIVRHAVADHFRKASQPLTEELVYHYVENKFYVDNKVFEGFEADRMRQLLQMLPEKTSAVFRKYVIEGYDHQEIADQMGMAVGTSKWHLSEARKLLQHHFTTLYNR